MICIVVVVVWLLSTGVTSQPVTHAKGVILGSSVAGETIEAFSARVKYDASPKGNLEGVVRDVLEMYYFLGGQGIRIEKIHSDVQDLSRRDVLRLLRSFFSDGATLDFVVYYSGHGFRNGSWAFKPKHPRSVSKYSYTYHYPELWESISYADVEKLWMSRRRSRAEQRLFIISDSCHSGWWAHQASLSAEGGANIVVQAAAGHEEEALDGRQGGVFTQRFLELDHDYPRHEWAVANPSSFQCGNWSRTASSLGLTAACLLDGALAIINPKVWIAVVAHFPWQFLSWMYHLFPSTMPSAPSSFSPVLSSTYSSCNGTGLCLQTTVNYRVGRGLSLGNGWRNEPWTMRWIGAAVPMNPEVCGDEGFSSFVAWCLLPLVVFVLNLVFFFWCTQNNTGGDWIPVFGASVICLLYFLIEGQTAFAVFQSVLLVLTLLSVLAGSAYTKRSKMQAIQAALKRLREKKDLLAQRHQRRVRSGESVHESKSEDESAESVISESAETDGQD